MKQFESVTPFPHSFKETPLIVKWSDDNRWVSIEHDRHIRVLDAANIEIEYIHTLDEPEIIIHSKQLINLYKGDTAAILYYILTKYLFSGVALPWDKLSFLLQDDRGPQPHKAIAT